MTDQHSKPSVSMAFSQDTSLGRSAVFSPELFAASGRLDFPMTNDYIFRAVLQTNNKALTGLISSLLHISPEKIFSVEITNPILLGKECQGKEFRLDINVILNNHSLINLEMQVVSQPDWSERSLTYLCRNFDSLSKGQVYAQVRPVIHIGILNFSLPSFQPEFYSQNLLMNRKTHQIYSDKFSLNVLNLNYIELATNEDKVWNLHLWAKLFKASTWEELKMIAQNNEYLTEASNSIFRMNADDMERKRALDREEYYRDIRTWKKQISEQKAILAEQEIALAEKEIALSQKDALIAELKAQLAAKS